jgi:SET domain-containing protein
MYRPLPNNLTIGKSKIDGLGLFATKKIDKNTNLGISHIKYKSDFFDQDYIRTPLGAFVNHSENPNCCLVYDGDINYLKVIKDIKINDELTTKYTLYKIGTSI